MKETKPLSKAVATLPGAVIGILWLAMAITAIRSSADGYANGRSGWGLGWGLVGFFLLAAAVAALVGTWWHNRRAGRNSH